jgi:hypothetical protein
LAYQAIIAASGGAGGGRGGIGGLAEAGHGDANLQGVDAADELEVHLILAVDADAATLLRPDLRAAEEMRRRGGQLGEVVVDVPGAVGAMHGVGDKLAEVIDAGDSDVAVVAEVVAFAALQRLHGLFVVQVHQVLHVVRLRPVGLLAEERVLEDVAPYVVVVRPRQV